MMHKNEKIVPLRGVWSTIAAGFDLTTKHLWLLILPIILDTFLWLGPRLSSRPIIEEMVALFPQDEALLGITDQILELAPRTNLFTSLSIPFIGIPVYMLGTTPENTPVPVQVMELTNPFIWLGLFLLFSVLGVLITAVYFTLIAQTIRKQDGQPELVVRDFFRRVSTTWLRLLGLGLIIAVIACIVYIPLLLVAYVAGFFSQIVATMVLLIGFVIILWLLILTYFVPHDLSLFGHKLYLAVLTSFQLVRIYFNPLLGLIIVILIIRNFLASLLLMADDGSWLTIAGILGHAFIMTSLTMATFIFFRDRFIMQAEKQRILRQQVGKQKS